MVRIAKAEELNRVNEIRRQVARLHSDNLPDIFRYDFPLEMQDEVLVRWTSENSDVLVVIKEEIIIGFAIVEYIDKPQSPFSLARKFYEVHEVGVDKECRRNGAGRELFEYIKNDAKQRGFKRIELDMWEFNSTALKFYEAMGFKTYRRYMETEV